MLLYIVLKAKWKWFSPVYY